MALLAWVMLSLALWHFTIFLPDRFWGGIAGACLGAIVGGVIIALIISGLAIPSRHDTDVLVVLYSVPGAVLGMGGMYWLGVRNERPRAIAH